MLDTSRSMGARELSLSLTPTRTTTAAAASSFAADTTSHSPTPSDGTEFFDAHDTLPWSPERARPARHSPAAVAARRMHLALWPAAEESAEKPHEEWPPALFTGINSSGDMTSLSAAVEKAQGPAAMRSRSSSLRSLFPSNGGASTSPSKLQPHEHERKGTHSDDAHPGAGAVGPIHASPSPRGRQPDALPAAAALLGTGKDTKAAAAAAAAAANPRSRKATDTSSQSYSGSGSGSADDVDDSSTVSGTTVTEEGWGSGHGSDLEGVGAAAATTAAAAAGLAAEGGAGNGAGYGDGAQATTVPSKRNSLRRVFDSARTLHSHRERRLRKMMSMGTRGQRAHTVAAPGAAAAAAATADSVSPALDSGATSPDAVPGYAREARSKTEAMAGEPGAAAAAAVAAAAAAAATTLGASSRPAAKCESCAESRSSLNGRRSCGYKFRRGGKAKGGDGGGNRPPEVHVKHHGRGGGKEKGWRSMHLVQRLKYHEGPIWTLKFNVHGTRIATAGQDGKVVIWDVAVPPEDSNPATTTAAEGAAGDDGTDTSNSNSTRIRRPRRRSSTEPLEDSGGTHGPEGAGGRGETYLDTESMSTAPSDDGSGGRPSSDLGLAGGGEGAGKDQGFSGSEVIAWQPARVFVGHKSDVVDLSWSHSDFLCSASIDHTVMLWHPHRAERLGTFNHPDFVTSVHFHPLDDHIFLTGCFDKRLRLWIIPDGRVVDWVQCQDMVSAASFTPDGQLAAAGLYNGRVMFYHTTGLRYYTQIHCRNRHGSKRRGKKVTGLDFVETTRLQHAADARRPSAGGADCAAAAEGLGGGAECGVVDGDGVGSGAIDAGRRQQWGGKADSMSSQYSLLTTTNDSRLRIYDLDHFSMTCKFKGLVNDGIQIKASFSEDGMFVVSGSEDGQVYLWNSKQCRHRASRSSGGSTGSVGSVGVGVGVGGVAGSSCPAAAAAAAAAVAAAAAATPAPTPATLVKSRTSSSFSIQCATSPKVATVAVFFPPAALDAACQAGVGAGCSAAAAADKLGHGVGIAKAGRGILHRSPSSPPETATGDGPHAEAGRGNGGDDGGGSVHATRRRWSFAGQALFGVKAHAQNATHSISKGQDAWCSSPPITAPLPPPPPRQQQQVENRIPRDTGETPAATSTGRPPADEAEESMTQGGGGTRPTGAAAAAALDAAGAAPAHPNAWGWGRDVRRFRARGGAVQAIVSADYNGEIKVFIGFAGGSEGSG